MKEKDAYLGTSVTWWQVEWPLDDVGSATQANNGLGAC